jgi:hypothetical protein
MSDIFGCYEDTGGWHHGQNCRCFPRMQVVQPSPVSASAGAAKEDARCTTAAGDHAFSCENGDACRHISPVAPALTRAEAQAIIRLLDRLAYPEGLLAIHRNPKTDEALLALRAIAEGWTQ